MRGFIQFPLILAGVLSLVFAPFSIFISSNNLAGLIGEAGSLQSQVNALRFPSDIEYPLLKYTDKKDWIYKDSLKSAWENAQKAKQAATDIQKIAANTKLSLSNGNPKLDIDVNIYNREAEVRAYFKEAVQEAYQTLQKLTNLIDSDKQDLDLIGADNKNFSKSQVFTELDRTLNYINSEIGFYSSGTRIEANPCDLQGIKYKTVCIIRKLRFVQTPAATDAIFAFNQIVGYPGPSLLDDYFEYHKNLTSLMLQMHNDYDDSLADFAQKTSELEKKLDDLDAQKIYLVKQEITDVITSQTEGTLAIAAGKSNSLSEKFAALKKELEQAELEKSTADRIFAQKQNDYLFLSTDQIRKLNSRLSDLLSSADSLKNSLADLRDKAKTAYNRLLQSNEQKKTTEFYLAAFELGKKAESKTLGESVVDYSQTIRYLLFVQNSDPKLLNLDSNLAYLRKVMDSLASFGIDVSYDQEQLSRLSRIDDESLYPSVYLSAQELILKLRGKADFGIGKLYDLRDGIASYFADYQKFLRNPSISQKLDNEKIDEYEKFFENSLLTDELSNLDELYAKYYEIENYLGETFNSIASDYLSDFISYSYDFLENPVCLNFSKARILLSVRNPTAVTFSDVILSKKLDLITDLENPVFFRINSISPGKIKYKEYEANVFYDCSNGSYQGNFTTNQTSVDKRFFELNNKLVQFCLLKECSKLRKIYTEAYSKNNISAIEEALSEEITAYLDQFKGKGVKSRLDKIELLLKDFSKAVDSKVDFEYNTTLIFSSADYSEVQAGYTRLKSIHGLLTPVSFSSKSSNDQFEELIGRFSPQDITDFFDNTASLENYLNSSLDSMKTEAKTALLSAKQNAMESGQGYDYLKKAMDSFNKGGYNKAILFAGQVSGGRKAPGFDLIYLLYLAIAIVLALFCIFLIRRPKEEKKIMRRLLHAT